MVRGSFLKLKVVVGDGTDKRRCTFSKRLHHSTLISKEKHSDFARNPSLVRHLIQVLIFLS